MRRASCSPTNPRWPRLCSLSANDAEIARLRTSIGNEIVRRIQIAAGPDADPRILDGTFLLFSGAMLQAGLGYFGFDEALQRIEETLELWSTA